MFAGKLLGKPIVIHEQNSLPGITTRIGSRWAKAIFYSFEQSKKYFSFHPNAILSGNPVTIDTGKITKAEATKALGLDPVKKTLLIFGGSQGSATLNDAIAETIEQLSEKYNIIWGTGKGNLPANIPRDTVVKEFIDDMQTAYSAADLAVTRAGAITLAELAAAGVPAILIPYPHAAEDHQRLNAEPLVEADAAEMYLDREFCGKVLMDTVNRLFNNPQQLAFMAENIKRFHNAEAGSMIADGIVKIVRHED